MYATKKKEPCMYLTEYKIVEYNKKLRIKTSPTGQRFVLTVSSRGAKFALILCDIWVDAWTN